VAGPTDHRSPPGSKPSTLCATKMKICFILILTLLCVSTFSQTLESIDSIVRQIDQTHFNDSISINLKSKDSTEPFQVTAFLKNDTLLKTIARFKNSSRLRFTYYEFEYKQYSNTLCAKDIDSTTNKTLLEVYGRKGIGVSSIILKINIVDPLEINSKDTNYPSRLLEYSNYSIRIMFALVDRKAIKYNFRGILKETVTFPPACGRVAFAVAQKFKVISTNCPNYKNKFVIIIKTCPEGLKRFFVKGKTYDLDVSTNSGVTFDYIIENKYQKDNLPTFWAKEIVKIN